MYKIEKGYLLASLLKTKKRYLNEEYVTVTELQQFSRKLYQKAGELNIPILCIEQYDLYLYFQYNEKLCCYTLKDGIGLDDILARFEGYLPFDVLKLLYTDEFMIDLLLEVEQQEIASQEKSLEKKKLLLKQLELEELKNKGRSK